MSFSRRTVTTALRQTYSAPKPIASRSFSIATQRQKDDPRVKTDKYPDKTHATRKDDRLDIQSDSSAKGRECRQQDTGGHATREKDEANSKSKAKQEFPESPVQIGFEDERGGKGH